MTTASKPHGAVPPAPAINATPEQWDAVRKACAERARERGDTMLADAFLSGSQDAGWAIRHELLGVVA